MIRSVVVVCLLVFLFCIPLSVRANLPATQGFGDCANPTVAVGTDGLARIAFSSDRTGHWQIYWGLYDQVGNCLVGPIQVTATSAASVSPRMDIDAQNRCFLIWFEGAGMSAAQHFARIEADGTVGVAPRGFNLATGTKLRADIGTAPDGTSHVVLEYYQLTFYRIHHGLLDQNGAVVRDTLVSDVDILGLDKYPSIDVDPSGTATMSWYDYAGFFTEGLYAAQCAADGTLGFSGRILDGTDIDWTTVLTADGSTLWILFQQRVGGVDRVRTYLGGGTANTISPAPGPTRKPRIAGSQGNPVYAVWEDWSTGTSRIMAAEWDATNQLADNALPISHDSVNAVTPDIAANADGQFYVVWKAGANIYYDSVKSYRLTVTAQVRANHADEDYISPPPPLPGVRVTMTAGEDSWIAETNAQGVAKFAVDPSEPVSYRLELAGSYYRIFTQQNAAQDVAPVATDVPSIPAGETVSIYLWEGGPALEKDPALQTAYYIQDLRRNYWAPRLDHDWEYWQQHGYPDRTAVDAYIYYEYGTVTKKSGGAIASGGKLLLMHFKCGEGSTVRHETHHALLADLVWRRHGRTGITAFEGDQEGGALDEGLADYFTASYANDPRIDRCNQSPLFFCVALRDISNPFVPANPVEYPTCGFDYESHEGSVILSAALWTLRGAIDGGGATEAPITDALVLGAVHRMLDAGPDNGRSYEFADFVDALLAEDTARGGAYQDEIRIVMGDHNLGPEQQPHCPASFDQNAGITDLFEEGATQVRLFWNDLGNVTYNLKVKIQDWEPDGLFMSDGYYTVATDLSDTSYVFDGRDPHTEYLFVVQPVATGGEVGFRSEPAFLPALDPTGVSDRTGVPSPAGRILHNTPNPFNPTTTIHFEVRDVQDLEVAVFDLRGKRVRTIRMQAVAPGRGKLVWNGRDGTGRAVASGVYLVQIRGRGWSDRAKVALLK